MNEMQRISQQLDQIDRNVRDVSQQNYELAKNLSSLTVDLYRSGHISGSQVFQPSPQLGGQQGQYGNPPPPPSQFGGQQTQYGGQGQFAGGRRQDDALVAAIARGIAEGLRAAGVPVPPPWQMSQIGQNQNQNRQQQPVG